MVVARWPSQVPEIGDDGIALVLGVDGPKWFIHARRHASIKLQFQRAREVVAHVVKAVEGEVFVERRLDAHAAFGIVAQLGGLEQAVEVGTHAQTLRQVKEVEIADPSGAFAFERSYFGKRTHVFGLVTEVVAQATAVGFDRIVGDEGTAVVVFGVRERYVEVRDIPRHGFFLTRTHFLHVGKVDGPPQHVSFGSAHHRIAGNRVFYPF